MEDVCSVACLQSGQGSGGRTTLVSIGVGCRNACGVVDSIDIVESLALSEVEWVDDIIQAFGTGAKLYGGSH
jgi:hypothetical protein